MDEEQEGIVIDPDIEGGIVLPDVDEEETEDTENTEVKTEDNQEVQEQEEKESDNTEDKLSSIQKALNAERKKNKELRKQLKASEANKNTKSTYDTLIEQGVEESLAKTIADAVNKPDDRVADLKFETDLLRVSKKAEFADIEDYSDEVREFVDKGLTIEQAYYAATGGKNINTKSEIKRELEAKMKNQKQKAEILDIDTNSSVTKPEQNKLKYSAIELAIAKKAGMTIEEYKAMQKMSTINEYDKHVKSQVKR